MFSFENKALLWPAQQTTLPKWVKFSVKHQKKFIGSASSRSYKIGFVGNNWLVRWLVGNAVFSETALRIFLIFCVKLRDYKGRKVTAGF